MKRMFSAFVLTGVLTGVITSPVFACADTFPYKTLIGKAGAFYPVESFRSEAACKAAAEARSTRSQPVWCAPLGCVDAPVNAAEATATWHEVEVQRKLHGLSPPWSHAAVLSRFLSRWPVPEMTDHICARAEGGMSEAFGPLSERR